MELILIQPTKFDWKYALQQFYLRLHALFARTAQLVTNCTCSARIKKKTTISAVITLVIHGSNNQQDPHIIWAVVKLWSQKDSFVIKAICLVFMPWIIDIILFEQNYVTVKREFPQATKHKKNKCQIERKKIS